jgi:hypothetical protein
MKRFRYPLACALVPLLGACSSDDSKTPDGDGMQPNVPGDEEPDGYQWPAGHADPCDPPLDTGYANDELCLEPPDPSVGYQLHFGPEDHDNPDDLNRFLLMPETGEDLTCVYDTTGNTEQRHIEAEHSRLRSGTHHMIVWAAPGGNEPNAPPDGTYAPSGCSNFLGLFHTGAQSGLGADGGVLDIPLPLEDGQIVENSAGYARLVQARTSVNIDLHYVNTTGEPILKEAWINEIYADESEVTKTLDPIFFLGGLSMNVMPKTTDIVGVDQCGVPATAPDGAEVMGISGHAHAHTSRISAWVNWSNGSRELIYETYDWAEPLNAEFDSIHNYPPPGDGVNEGAHSGPLVLQPGDTFGWECEVTNHDLDQPLNFANEAYTGEMCNIFGFYVPGTGGMWPCGLAGGNSFTTKTSMKP